MALTAEEYESQIESLNATIKSVTDADAKTASEIQARDAKIAELTVAVSKSPAADYEAVKAKAAKVDDLEKANANLQSTLMLNELKGQYPSVDFTLVPAGTKESMTAHAAKLQQMVDAAVKKVAPAPNGAGNPSSNPGQRWEGIPPASGDTEEVRRQQEAQAGLDKAKASGNAGAVFDAIIAQKGGVAKVLGLTK